MYTKEKDSAFKKHNSFYAEKQDEKFHLKSISWNLKVLNEKLDELHQDLYLIARTIGEVAKGRQNGERD